MNIKNVTIANELLQNIKESYIENNEKHFSEKKEQVEYYTDSEQSAIETKIKNATIAIQQQLQADGLPATFLETAFSDKLKPYFRNKLDYVVLDNFGTTTLKLIDYIDDASVYNYLSERGFSSRYISATWQKSQFNNIKDLLYSQLFLKEKKLIGLYFYGALGIGKSSLLGLIAKMLYKYFTTDLRFIKSQKLVDLVSSFDKADVKQTAELMNVDYLFIDGLGFESFVSEWQVAKLLEFFEFRYGNEKINYIASNIDIRLLQNKNTFYKQLASFLIDKSYNKTIELKGRCMRCCIVEDLF